MVLHHASATLTGSGSLSPTGHLLEPDDISDLGLWLKPDAGITTDDTGTQSVSHWANQAATGSAYDADQAVKVNQPLYGGSTLNGYTAIKFDTSLFMSFSGNGLNLARNKPGLSFFVVMDAPIGSQQNILSFAQGNTASADARFNVGITSGDAFQFGASTSDNNSSVPYVSGGSHSAVPEIFSGTYDTSSQTVTLYRNGVQVYTDSSFGPSVSGFADTAASSALLGSYIFYMSDNLKGYLYEIVVFERALSATEFLIVQGYLQSKYAISSSGTEHHGSATLSGMGTITASSWVAHHAASTLTGAGSLSSPAWVAHHGSATLSGLGTITPSGWVAHHASATLSATGSISSSSAVSFKASASFLGSGSLTASSFVAHHAASTLSGAGSLSGTAWIAHNASSTLPGLGTLAATAELLLKADATLTGSGSLSASAGGLIHGDCSFSGSGSFSAIPHLFLKPAVSLLGQGSFSASANRIQHASSALLASGLISATAKTFMSGSAILSGSGILLINGTLIKGNIVLERLFRVSTQTRATY